MRRFLIVRNTQMLRAEVLRNGKICLGAGFFSTEAKITYSQFVRRFDMLCVRSLLLFQFHVTERNNRERD